MPDSVYRTGLTECEWQCVYSREMNYYVYYAENRRIADPPGSAYGSCPPVRMRARRIRAIEVG